MCSRLVSSEVNLVLNKDCVWVNLEGGGLLGGVLEIRDVVVVVVEIRTRRLKLKPRINLPRCSHQERREQQDIGRHRGSICACWSIIIVCHCCC